MSTRTETPKARAGPPARLLAVYVSLALNVTLAAWLAHRASASASAAQSGSHPADGPGIAVGALGGLNESSGATAGATNGSFPFRWSQIESADYRQYIANLRAVGCPEQVIRDLVAADLSQHYIPRMQAILKPKRHDYWRKYENDQASPAQMKELTALDHEKAGVFKELFGTPMSGQQVIDALFLQLHGSEQELLFLPADRREAAMQVLRETGFDEKELGGSTPPDQLTDEKMRLLAQVLSPDELNEFRTRYSPGAQVLRTETQYFDCTPDEFKLLLDARGAAAGDSQTYGNLLDRTTATEQVRTLLGDDRAEEFARVTDMFYIHARDALAAQQLPPEAADQAWQISRDARAAASDLAKDGSLSGDERNLQIQAVQDQANLKLNALLGDKGARIVRQDLAAVLGVNRAKPPP